jgi:hypothetical protein
MSLMMWWQRGKVAIEKASKRSERAGASHTTCSSASRSDERSLNGHHHASEGVELANKDVRDAAVDTVLLTRRRSPGRVERGGRDLLPAGILAIEESHRTSSGLLAECFLAAGARHMSLPPGVVTAQGQTSLTWKAPPLAVRCSLQYPI